MSVEAGRLLRELESHWREAAAGALRACSMTLVAVVRPDEDPQALGLTIAEIMHEYPSRAILLRVGAGNELAARTSIQCWMPFGRRQQVCSEQIEIDCGLEALEAVVPLLLGLMVPDLPVAVWCPDLELASQAALRPVLRLAGQVLIDSAKLPDARRAAPCLRRIAEGPWRLSDLTWGRITRWRETVAQLVAGCPEPVSCEVRYAGEGVAPAAAYLGAWCRLALGCPVTLTCADPRLPEAGLGRLRDVTLTGDCGQVRLSRTAKTVLSVECGRVPTTVVFPLHTEALLLRTELGLGGRDRQFEAALAGFEEVL